MILSVENNKKGTDLSPKLHKTSINCNVNKKRRKSMKTGREKTRRLKILKSSLHCLKNKENKNISFY